MTEPENEEAFSRDAKLMVDGRRIWVGLYDTPQAAHAAYLGAAKRFHKEFAHG